MHRTAMRLLAAVGVIVVLVGLPLSGARAQTSGNWSTYLNNGARTGYNGAEWLITPSTAPKLTKLWTDSAGGSISAQPIQVNGVLYYGSWYGHEHAAVASTAPHLSPAYLVQTTNPTCLAPTTAA